MKKFFLVTFLLISTISLTISIKAANTLANSYLSDVDRAMSGIIEHMGPVTTIDVIIIGDSKGIFDHVVRKIFSYHHEKSLQLIKFKQNDEVNYKIYNPIILLVESDESYGKFLNFRFHPNLSSYKYLKILIICPDLTRAHLSFRDEFYRYSSFLMIENGNWCLISSKTFYEPQISKKKAIILNSMDEKSRWRHNEFFPPPITDFHGYEFQFRIREFLTRMYSRVVKRKIKGDQYEINGVNMHIISLIRKLLNFRVFYNPTVDDRSYFIKKKDSVNLYYKPFQSLKNANLGLMMPYESLSLKFVTPPGQSFTKYEKLLLAFDGDTWILIIVIFTIAFLAIFLINFMSKEVQGIVYGSRVHSPALNVIVAFCGLGQMILPRRSFGRFLLMCFILYSMIIRTAYQGVSFDLLQKDLRKPSIQTLQEALDKNFTVYTRLSFLQDWNETSLMKWHLNTSYTFELLLQVTTNTSAQAIVLVYRDDITTALRHFKWQKKIPHLEQDFASSFHSLAFQLNHDLFEPFSELLKRVFEAGFIQKLCAHFKFRIEYSKTKPFKAPRVLSLSDLSAGFEICLIAILVSFIVFILEITYANRQTVLELILSPIVFIYIKFAYKNLTALVAFH